MSVALGEEQKLYLQISSILENDILQGVFPEESRVPSTNELAKLYTVNPATAAKGLNILAEEGILYKKRGIGMFVAKGAAEQIRDRRHREFFETKLLEIMQEAKKIGISTQEMIQWIEEKEKDNE